MRRWRVTVMAALGCLLMTSAAAVASDEADPTNPNARRDEVVALVLAQDARFTDVPDYERQRVKMAATFSFDAVLGSSYYRVLPTVTTQWSDSTGVDLFAFRQPRNWLVEVALVRDCVPVEGGQAIQPPLPDPCAWRHAWYYRVQSNDSVTLLFEEGDPDTILPN